MLLVLAVAVVVIGPKDLPRALHAAGKFIRKFKAFTGDIQKSLDNIMREEDLNEITREANRIGGDNLQFEIDRQYEAEQARRRALDTAEIEEKEDAEAEKAAERKIEEGRANG